VNADGTLSDDKTRVHIITTSLEYGVNASGVGTNVFRKGRAVSRPEKAAKSNFLHPIVRQYTITLSKLRNDYMSVPTQHPPIDSRDVEDENERFNDKKKTRGNRRAGSAHWTPRKPTARLTHHMLEDFLGEWTLHNYHIGPLRMFFRRAFDGMGYMFKSWRKAGEEGYEDDEMLDEASERRIQDFTSGVDPSCVWYDPSTGDLYDFSPHGQPDDDVLLPGVFTVRHDAGAIRFGLCGAASSMPCGTRKGKTRGYTSALLWLDDSDLPAQERCRPLSSPRMLPDKKKLSVEQYADSKRRYVGRIGKRGIGKDDNGIRISFAPGMTCERANAPNIPGQRSQSRTQLDVDLICDPTEPHVGKELPASSLVDIDECHSIIEIRSIAGCALPKQLTDRVDPQDPQSYNGEIATQFTADTVEFHDV